MKLATFLKQPDFPPLSKYIAHEDFDDLYMRRCSWAVCGRRIDNVTVIARIAAKHPGTGAFTRLISQIDTPLVIEAVGNVRFRNHLRRIGFQQLGEGNWYRDRTTERHDGPTDLP